MKTSKFAFEINWPLDIESSNFSLFFTKSNYKDYFFQKIELLCQITVCKLYNVDKKKEFTCSNLAHYLGDMTNTTEKTPTFLHSVKTVFSSESIVKSDKIAGLLKKWFVSGELGHAFEKEGLQKNSPLMTFYLTRFLLVWIKGAGWKRAVKELAIFYFIAFCQNEKKGEFPIKSI